MQIIMFAVKLLKYKTIIIHSAQSSSIIHLKSIKYFNTSFVIQILFSPRVS